METKKPFGVVSVKERLERLQQQNYRSLPFKKNDDKKPTVAKEIEQFKEKQLIAPAESTSIVKERLEKLKEMPIVQERPIEQKEEQKPVTQENILQNKVEKALKRAEDLKAKMSNTENYLSLFYEFKKAEEELLFLLDEAKQKSIEMPYSVIARVERITRKR